MKHPPNSSVACTGFSLLEYQGKSYKSQHQKDLCSHLQKIENEQFLEPFLKLITSQFSDRQISLEESSWYIGRYLKIIMLISILVWFEKIIF